MFWTLQQHCILTLKCMMFSSTKQNHTLSSSNMITNWAGEEFTTGLSFASLFHFQIDSLKGLPKTGIGVKLCPSLSEKKSTQNVLRSNIHSIFCLSLSKKKCSKFYTIQYPLNILRPVSFVTLIEFESCAQQPTV